MVPAPSPTRKYFLGRLSLLYALLAGLVVLVPPAAVSAVPASPHGVALIIGNADYEPRDVPDVTFAHRDADAFRRDVVDVLDLGVADGLLGPRTRAELRASQKKKGYPETGRLSGEQAGCCGAARGTTVRGSCVPRTATISLPETGSASPVSELPGHWIES